MPRIRRPSTSLSSNDGSDDDFSALDGYSTAGDGIDDCWVKLKLKFSDSLLNGFGCIAFKYGAIALSNDGAVIELVVDKVHSATS